ncbi:monovalent cation/H+ antiporter subunit D [Pseudorhodoplanes sp.]|uniref:monovalent cation/H+ antiporter subunit D n=1 Tax=Pseudorhodoplanes sp. TaxID=1934341 RepID=UPI00391B9FCA
MNQELALPFAIPAMTAAILVLVARYGLNIQRLIAVVATAAQVAVAIWLYVIAGDGEPRVYLLGYWPAPYGIVLVLDRLAATMLLLSGVLACAVLVSAIGQWDQRGRHFHALFQFQLLGINGAFLTGDLFNLFVFFEVLLIASYGLMLHGGGPLRLKAGFAYVAINLVGSTVFLFAVGTIYAVTGTLNMADLALKVRSVTAGNEALLATGALLLFTVFAIKSAMVPLHWWLPPTYASTSPPAAALFAIMTKVGAYSIIRIYTLIFGADAGALANIALPWIMPAAIVTLVFGTFGVVASRSIPDLVAYSVVASMGTLLIAVGLNSADGLAAALYYAVQSTLTSAGLFLLAGLLANRDGIAHAQARGDTMLLAGLFFLLAIAMVGMPPLAGFLGKLLILDAGRAAAQMQIVWPAILITSLMLILGFARAGIRTFWIVPGVLTVRDGGKGPLAGALAVAPVAAIGGLIAAMAALTVLAGPLMADMNAAAEQLRQPARYIEAVLSAKPRWTAMVTP